jgi:membrane-bound serine protease (ClpP class)
MARVRWCSFALIAQIAWGAVGLAPALASSKEPPESAGSIEVVEVKGIIDGSVERAVAGNIDDAHDAHAALVVLQIDSAGVVDEARTRRLVSAVARSEVPVAAWVGPPGARAEDGAARIVEAARIRAMSPGSSLGPQRTLDLRTRYRSALRSGPMYRPLSADAAREAGLVRFVEPSLDDLITTIDDRSVLDIDVDTVVIRFHKLDIWGRALHAAAQPSMTYLFLLLALVGIVFELFHPSTGPAGISGLIALALSAYGMVVLGGSWLGFVLIAAGVGAFCVDLRYQGLGIFTLIGFAGLVGGSLLLFPGPYLRVSPWVLAFGIVAMVMFLLGAMTRVLRDLRLIARGELEVTDAHPTPGETPGPPAPDHANGQDGGPHGS